MPTRLLMFEKRGRSFEVRKLKAVKPAVAVDPLLKIEKNVATDRTCWSASKGACASDECS